MSFWDYALESHARILNMVPAKKVEKTPYELWHGKVPNMFYLKAWGCEELMKCNMTEKLEPRSVKYIFIEHPNEMIGPSTLAVVEHMRRVLYASAVGSIMYVIDNDIKSQTEYIFVLNGAVVDWKSFKQNTTMKSSTEAENMAASKAAMEVIWIRKFIDSLGVISNNKEPIEMNYINTGAKILANEPGVLKGTRHYRRKVDYVREVIEEGDIKLLKVYTDDNVVDPFSKALPFIKHNELAWSIGLRSSKTLM
uniref:Retrotransposon protein, putative, Ty1-copia subclass n=1 Tax=Tanacetum cinerariifolium TaxID=118510 RepID=A0A6L2JSH5_TANCI|nr:hypothetical protein [Tanacetum cinerariifolium]